ncbi:hypothetical protein L6164_005964 [Bauhinia variegata]|uniref:Uncharacterized protein n=1 Tax=Bauhinia variegata TaxID=167791 RepID=A0ACB9PYB4_BAUVA|nr:hypothetical protein L6164_005964 [Bauhinia variegata]
MKEAIVLYPYLGRGHLVSMVELGKLILTHHPSFSITILILKRTTITPASDSIAKYIASVSAVVPSITFHHLPIISYLPANIPPQIQSFELCRLSNPNVHHVLQTISGTSKLKAFVLDPFSFAAAEVTAALNIPTYYYSPSAATTLALTLHMPTLHQNSSLKDLGRDAIITIPGLPRISVADIPDPMKNHWSKSYENFLIIANNMKKSDGIIVNTFEFIETTAISALNDGLCVPEGPTPPVFCVGPLFSAQDEERDENGCLSWLNSQPSQSVVYLNFGSLGRFPLVQIKEMALGLEKSGQSFLWVVRDPPPSHSTESGELSLEELLPEGFLERTKEKGLVVKNWAPQVPILRHDSVGGFVSHCGWNSVLEAVSAGVPMVTWPLYAEQKLNRVLLVQEMKVALALNESKDGSVSGDELEKRVRELMESDRGKEVRERIRSITKNGMKALEEGGTSRVALNRLAQLWSQN